MRTGIVVICVCVYIVNVCIHVLEGHVFTSGSLVQGETGPKGEEGETGRKGIPGDDVSSWDNCPT